ncbi:hypothetical protein PM082_012388 [Marasmius tenuissimus]|nr:hypothetical protein PM082_012388 [Marasmius tenuissimus]
MKPRVLADVRPHDSHSHGQCCPRQSLFVSAQSRVPWVHTDPCYRYKGMLSSPVTRLPPELLGHIFLLYVEALLDKHTLCAPRSITLIVMVCRLWKTVAYSTPAIWSTPDFTFPRLARNMLLRSKATPLNILWKPTCRYYVDPLDQDRIFIEAARQTSRIASLDLLSGSVGVATLFRNAWSKMTEPAPLLHTIRIYCLSGLKGNQSISLPDSFLAGKAPRLTKLVLTGCSISWRSALLDNLTYLTMRYPPESLKPTVQTVFHALQRLSSLVHLELRHCISPTSLPSLPSDKSPSFPCLRQMTLSVESEACLALLERIAFPDTTALHLICYDVPRSFPVEQVFVHISHLLAPPVTDPNHPRVIRGLALAEELSLSLIARNHDNCELWSDVSDEYGSVAVSAIPHLRLDVRTRQPERAATIHALLSLIPLIHLESLRVGFASPFPLPSMVYLLEKSKQLKSLFLQDNVSPSSLDLLSRGCLFPTLRKLTMVGVDFRPETAESPLLESLLDSLDSYRAEHGRPFEELVLNECVGIYTRDLQRVQSRVRSVGLI